MATVTLKYGRDGLSVDFPETPGFVGVLEPRHQPALTNPDLTVRVRQLYATRTRRVSAGQLRRA